MSSTTPFMLFAHCIPVKGHSRSIIADLQRNKIHLIPQALFDLLTAYNGKTILFIKEAFGYKFDKYIDEYFDFLTEQELIFFTAHPEWFPPMSRQWDSPVKITNAIIDLDQSSQYDIAAIFSSLDRLGCGFAEIRVYDPLPQDALNALLRSAAGTTVTSVRLVASYNIGAARQDWISLCDKHSILTSLVVHRAPENESFYSDRYHIPMRYATKRLTDETCCGIISENFFTAGTESFTESLQHNSCLNRKISVDARGYIRNCPSMQKSFGHIDEITLEEALEKTGFKKYWDITKDQVAVCRDCEFRHVCTDCRAYLEDPGDIYSKPLKCGYDPYTCEWQDWSSHPIKQQAIDHYFNPNV